jgi:hypothetical protein
MPTLVRGVPRPLCAGLAPRGLGVGFVIGFVALGAAVLWAAPTGRAQAAAVSPSTPRTVLVELFTSQGCSSCPAADAFVRDLPSLGLGRARVVPLTFHVDYWNGLGWKDPFSSPAFTDRQQHYVDAGMLRGPEGHESLSGLYTPQMIVDGAVHFSGRERDVARAEIRRAAERAPVLDLAATATLEGDQAHVTARVTPRAPGGEVSDLRLWVAVVQRSARTNVTHGENGGETLEEAAVVRALSTPVPISLAPGAPPVRVTVARPADLPWSAAELAVVVQSGKTLHVEAAEAVIPSAAATGTGAPK